MPNIEDEPVSAFAMYKQKNQNTSKPSKSEKNKKNKLNTVSNTNLKKSLKVKTKDKSKVNLNAISKASFINEIKTSSQNDELLKLVKFKPNDNSVVPKNINMKKTHEKVAANKKKHHLNNNKNQNSVDTTHVKKGKIKENESQKVTTNKQKIKSKKMLKNKSSLKEIPLKNVKSKVKITYVKEINLNLEDSVQNGEQIFQSILYPLDIKKFFSENWEKEPITIKRNSDQYFSTILSCEDINHALREKQLYFSKNIDVTSYDKSSGKRETHNPAGRANAPLVWDFYSNGCSIRILNPQTFFPKVHSMNASLQEYFGCFVGANVYLTPPGTQGFAPHYDDIEAFVIQLEGKKLWKLYSPRSDSEVLPRYSSGNFTEDDLGTPIQEILLEAGDTLYFPRGVIHQGNALPDTHSLHITLSMYQKNSWADLLETLLPATLKCAVEEDVSFREGLPLNYLSHLGVVNSDKDSNCRTEFLNKLANLFAKLVDYAPVDAAVDQLGKKFVHDSMPPYLRKWEKERTCLGDGEIIRNGVVSNQAEMSLSTRIKLVRYNSIRLVSEEDSLRLYYSISNSKEYHGEEAQYIEINENEAPAIETLLNAYPNFIVVEDIPIDDDIGKINIASVLWEHGIVMTDEPLGYTDVSSSSDDDSDQA